jgi:hypothetical protein
MPPLEPAVDGLDWDTGITPDLIIRWEIATAIRDLPYFLGDATICVS